MIGALIPVRLKSERLPGKALLPIGGRPALWHLLDRVCVSKFLKPDQVVVCTTEDASDDRLEASVREYGCEVFRGSENDIIDRMYQAVRTFGFSEVIQVDGDDILCATEYMDATMERLLEDPSLDIVLTTDLPLGVGCKSFRADSLNRVREICRTANNDTGFTYYFTKTGLFKQDSVFPKLDKHRLGTVRLTLDYQEDFDVFKGVLEGIEPLEHPLALTTALDYLRQHPDLAAKNMSLNEQYWERTREKAQLRFADADGVERTIPV